MGIRKTITNRDLYIISQGLSALGNYFPMALALLSKNLGLIGQIAIFQSLFTIFLSITRSGMGFAMLKAAGNNMKIQSLKPALLVLYLFVLPTTFLYCEYSLNSDYSLFLLFSFILIFAITQEYYRAKLISSNNYIHLFFADLIWLVACLITAVIIWDNFSLSSISVTFLFGPFSSLIYIFIFSRRFRVTKPRLEVKAITYGELISLSAIPLITFVSVFVLNVIWSTKHGVQDLGIVRGLFLFFIPIQFLLSVFPHMILKEKLSHIMFFNEKKRLGFLIMCASFSLMWAEYSGILSMQTLLMVIALTFSMYSVIASQEITLLRISEGRVKMILCVRFSWGVLIVLLACIWPASNSTPLHLALIIAFTDFLYRIVLNSRFLSFRERNNDH